MKLKKMMDEYTNKKINFNKDNILFNAESKSAFGNV